MTRKEWRYEALRLVLIMKRDLNSPYRRVREYANYVKRFFFGDGDITFDGNNETWQMRLERRELPMPYNIYMMG